MGERAAGLLAELREEYPWLEQADGVLVDLLVRSAARVQMLSEYVDGVVSGEREAYPRRGFPTTGVEAVPERVWLALAQAERNVALAAGKLGFAPADRAKLFRDAGMARSLELAAGREAVRQLAERGRRLRAARAGSVEAP